MGRFSAPSLPAAGMDPLCQVCWRIWSCSGISGNSSAGIFQTERAANIGVLKTSCFAFLPRGVIS